MNDDIKVGVLMPTGSFDPRELVAFGAKAERLGFDSLFVNDSLLTPRIEPLTMLAALAPATSRVTLGTGALMPFTRRPVQAAQTLASIDQLSGGRLTVTVGAGFPGRFGRPLYDMSEVPWERRFARLDETVALWRRLWSADGPVSFHGSLMRFDDIPVQTRPFRAGGPPIWLAGATPAALERAGRLYDGWLPYPPDPLDYRKGLAAVLAAGRAVTPALFVTVLIAEDGRATLEEYSQSNYGLSSDEVAQIQAVVSGPGEHVVERLRAYIDAGARHLVIRIGTLGVNEQLDQLEQLAAHRGDLLQP